jgi:phosphatidate cytidylyltransferase
MKGKNDTGEGRELKKNTESGTSESEPGKNTQKNLKTKLASFKVRTISSIIMVLLFAGIISAGHAYCCGLVLLINILIFKEIIALKRNQQRDAKLPYFYVINWYFFFATELVVTSLFISQKIIKSHYIDVRTI